MRRKLLLGIGLCVVLAPVPLIGASKPAQQGAPSTAVPIAQASNPIPGVGIVVKRNPGTATANGVTGSDGRFSFSGLKPGNYTLTVRGQPSINIVVGVSGQIAGVATTSGVQMVNTNQVPSAK